MDLAQQRRVGVGRAGLRLVVLVWLLTGLAVACHQGPVGDGQLKTVTFSVLEDYDKGADLGTVAADFALMRELGITTWRGSLGWDDYEPSPGAYDFAWLHEFAALADRSGMTLRPYIAYTPGWAGGGGRDGDASNDPPVRLSDWAAFAGRLAAEMRRHPSVVSFEIYNEENVPQWWEGTASAYRDVLARAAEAIREANPRAQVIAGGLVYPDSDWVESICDDPEPLFQVLPFHAYPETWTPAGITVENYVGHSFAPDFVGAADRLCGRPAIWINELGFATMPGRDEAEQADWWARAIATYVAAPRIEHLGVYEIKDRSPSEPSIGGTPNYHLGLTRVDRSRKPAFGTVQRLVSLLGGTPLRIDDEALVVRAIDGDVRSVFRHLFTAGRRRVLVIWTRERPAVVDVEVPGGGSTVIEYDTDGTAERSRDILGGRLTHVALQPGHARIFSVQ
jgi:hypothetical protein